DYVPKPFDPREVLARVKSLLRRLPDRPPAIPAARHDDSEIVKIGGCILDLAAHRLYAADGEDIPLTNTEFDLLRVFARHPNRVLSRGQLLDLIQRDDLDPFDRSIDLRVMRLRRKVENDPERPQVLKTVRGAGYIFVSGQRRSGVFEAAETG